MNSRKPNPIIPCTAKARARNPGGKSRPNTDTAKPYKTKMKVHSIMEPS